MFSFLLCSALAAVPLAATPIATGPDGLNTLVPGGGSLTYQVVMSSGISLFPSISSQGFVGPATFTSTGTMALSNLLTPGSTVTSAVLDLTVLSSLTQGSVTGYYNCSGGSLACVLYGPSQPTITVGSAYTTVTVVSTSGTTYTWNHQVTSSSPFQLNLATADPSFLADLSNGLDLNISWTQTVQLSGSYPSPTFLSQCPNCTLTFHYDGLSRSTTVQASVNGDVTGPPDPTATPEPSTGLLLGLGIIGMAGTLRRKLYPR
jgi:hypothetical protein